MNRLPWFSSHSSPDNTIGPASHRSSYKILFCFTFGRKLFGFARSGSLKIQPRFIMKKYSLYSGAALLLLLAGLASFNFGCGKPATPPPPANPPAGTPPAAKTLSAERTSFAEVTAQLDPGGNFYLYLGTAQWLEHLSTKVESWRTSITALPDLSPENTGYINKGFDIADHLIKDSGIEDITGMGMSSVEIEKGMFHNKMMLHHYPDVGTGFLWKLCGKEPHALTGLDLLPADTALAAFSDVDLPLVWKVTQDEVAKSGFPQAQEFLQQLPGEFEQKTQLKWDAVLNSIGGECGFVLTLNESNTIPIPLPGMAMTIPEPGLLLVLRVNDDTLFNRIDQELKSNPQIISVEKSGLRMRTMPVPIPFLGELRPSTASSGGYLFIASSDALINEVLAVKSGQTPGLKSTAEFKRLAQNIPDRGNQFTFMSERFGRILFQVQKQVINGQMAKGGSAVQAEWMQTLFHNRPAFAYSVSANTPQGCLTIGNSSQSFANMILLPAVAVPAMLAAIAVPNFVKARSTSQQNACLNNLRQIDAAKQQWALENSKKSTDVPTQKDLLPYLGRNGQFPRCPQGGTYTIGSVGESPRCSVAGHELP
jgi:hypothetical protein